MSLRRRRGTDSPAPFFVPCRTFVSLCAGLIAFLHMWAGAGIIMHCEVSHARPGLRARYSAAAAVFFVSGAFSECV